MEIVERIKLKCKEKGTSMGALEKEFGFGNGNIRRWDERMPGADRMYIIANRLDVTVEWLLTGKTSAQEYTPEEQQLVDYYRAGNDAAQKLILSNAKTTSEQLPRERESSTSNVG